MPDKRIYTHLLPALICLVIIFSLSSIPRLTGPDLGIPFADKVFHLIEYAGTGFFMARFLEKYLNGGKFQSRMTFLGIMAVVATCDELYQGLIPGRFTDGADLIADIVGASLGGFLFTVWSRCRRIQ